MCLICVEYVFKGMTFNEVREALKETRLEDLYEESHESDEIKELIKFKLNNINEGEKR